MPGTRKKPAVLAWLSLGLVTVPVGFYWFLVSGGGSEGFYAWNDVAWLALLIFLAALAGLILAVFSSKRGEQSRINVLAVILHCALLALLGFALSQAF